MNQVANKKRKGEEIEVPALKRKEYEQKLRKLDVELVKLQEWVKSEGKKVCIMTTNKSLKVDAEMVQYMGKTLEAIARNLFGNLRKADKNSIDVIIVEGTPYNNTGFAIMNRLKKAAITCIRV